MIQAKCIQKFRDKNNNIYGYRLIDINGQTQDVKPENLKQAIKNNQIHVVNLTLTSDNRLVDTTEKQLQNIKVLGQAPKEPEKSYADKEMEWLKKIATITFKGLGYTGIEYCGDGDENHEFMSNEIEAITYKSLAFELLSAPKEEYKYDYDEDIEDFESNWGLAYIMYGELKSKTVWLHLGSRTFEMDKYQVRKVINSKEDLISLISEGKELYKKYKKDEEQYQRTLTKAKLDEFRALKISNKNPTKKPSECKTLADFFS